MSRGHYIGLDTHCESCEMAVITARGELVKRQHCKTTIPSLLEAIEGVARPRYLVFEEGPLADWLFRSLRDSVDKIMVCDPRRNHLIAKDGDKDDPIDAPRLAQLYRGGYVKPIHHPETLEQSVFKQHVGLYHDRVRNRVRQALRIIWQFRRHGMVMREGAFVDPKDREDLLKRLPPSRLLRTDLRLLWEGYDVAVRQVTEMRRLLVRQARREPQIRRFTAIPGVKWIRATTFFVYVDTPWRFRSPQALWKYLGIGLERRHSGNGPVQLRPPALMNRPLKNAILGAAKSAIASRNNPFAEQYERWLNAGIKPRTARRNVARSQAAVMWGMWKNGSVYQPEWVGVAAAARVVMPSK
jgi:transposase